MTSILLATIVILCIIMIALIFYVAHIKDKMRAHEKQVYTEALEAIEHIGRPIPFQHKPASKKIDYVKLILSPEKGRLVSAVLTHSEYENAINRAEHMAHTINGFDDLSM